MFVIVLNLVYLALYGKSFRIQAKKRKIGSPTQTGPIWDSLTSESGLKKVKEHSTVALYKHWYTKRYAGHNQSRENPLRLSPGDIIICEQWELRTGIPGIHWLVKKTVSPQGLFGGHLMIAISEPERVPERYEKILQGYFQNLPQTTQESQRCTKFDFTKEFYLLIVMESASDNDGITFRVMVLNEAKKGTETRLLWILVEPHLLLKALKTMETIDIVLAAGMKGVLGGDTPKSQIFERESQYNGDVTHLLVFGPPPNVAKLAEEHHEELHQIIAHMHKDVSGGGYKWGSSAAAKAILKGMLPASLRASSRKSRSSGQVNEAKDSSVICSSIPLMMWSSFLSKVLPSAEADEMLGNLLPLTVDILPKHLVNFIRKPHGTLESWEEKFSVGKCGLELMKEKLRQRSTRTTPATSEADQLLMEEKQALLE